MNVRQRHNLQRIAWLILLMAVSWLILMATDAAIRMVIHNKIAWLVTTAITWGFVVYLECVITLKIWFMEFPYETGSL